MRELLLLFFLSLLVVQAIAQTDTSFNESKTDMPAEQIPEFPGGDEALVNFLNTHIQYPKIQRDSGIQGKVMVKFVIDTTDRVTQAKVAKSVDAALDAEALRIVQTLPNFKPGLQSGKPVNVYYLLPVEFKLTEKDLDALHKNSDEDKMSGELKSVAKTNRKPEFPGGEYALLRFISQHIQYPKIERDNNIEGMVLVKFVVDQQGKIGEVQIDKGVSPGMDKEAVRVVKTLPEFKPAIENGKVVNADYYLPVKFNIPGNPALVSLIENKYKKRMRIQNDLDLYKQGYIKWAVKAFLMDGEKTKDGLFYAIAAECYRQLREEEYRCASLQKAFKLGYTDAEETLKIFCDK